jgi:hypothetical protein
MDGRTGVAITLLCLFKNKGIYNKQAAQTGVNN